MPETDAIANPDLTDSRLIVGCGYLGRRIAARWLNHGRRVFATTRGRQSELQSLGVSPIVADICSRSSLPTLPPCAAAVFCVGFDRGGGQSLRDIYVEGLANVLAALPTQAKFIYVSSTGVYGDAAGEWVDESTPPNPADESGRVICEAEELLRRNRPDAIVLRFAGIYGPGRLLRRIDALNRGEPIPGTPDRWLNLIHVEDGAAAVLAAEGLAAPGSIYNICDDEPVRRGEYFAELANRIGASPPTFSGGPESRGRGDRRVSNRLMHADLRLRLAFPTFRDGLASAGIAPNPEF